MDGVEDLFERAELSDAWAAEVRGAEPSVRRELVDRARELRVAPASKDAYRAHCVVRALADEIEVAEERNARLWIWALAESRPDDPMLMDLCRRVSRDCPVRETRLRAQLRLGRLLDFEDRREEAREQLDAVVREVAGEGTRLEEGTWFNLARVAMRRGRLFEALVHLDRVARLAHAREEVRGLFQVEIARIDLHGWAQDLEAADAAIARARELLDRSPGPGSDARRVQLGVAATRIALQRNDGEATRREFEAVTDLARPGSHAAPGSPWHRYVQAEIASLEGRTDEALRLHDEARELLGESSRTAIWSRVDTADLLAGQGDLTGARREAERVLRDVAVAGSEDPWFRLRVTVHLAETLAPFELESAFVRELFDRAVADVFEHLRELSDASERLRSIVTLSPEELVLLRDHRQHWVDRRTTLCELLAETFEAGVRRDGPEFLASLFDDHAQLRVCAWCERVGTRSGDWLAIAEYVPTDAPVDVTHTICETCREAVRREHGI